MNLRQRLQVRVKLAFQRLEILSKKRDLDLLRNQFNLNPNEFVDIYERTIVGLVEGLVESPRLRRVVLDHSELTDRWDLHWYTTANLRFETRAFLEALGAAEYSSGSSPAEPFWPPNVAPTDLAEVLERTRDDDALALAKSLRSGLVFPYEGRLQLLDEAYTRAAPSLDFGSASKDEAELTRQATVTLETIWAISQGRVDFRNHRMVDETLDRAMTKWPVLPCALIVSVMRTVQAAYAQHARLPTNISGALIAVRSGQLADGTKPSLDPSGRTFPIPGDGFTHWKLLPPKGQISLSFPLECGFEPGPGDVRSIVTGTRLRTWWATWVLAFEREKPDGFWNWDPRHIILDVFGATPEWTTTKGKRYARPPRGLERQIAKDFLHLESWMVTGIGDFSFMQGEPLVHRFGEVQRNGRTIDDVNLCAHARLAWLDATKSFVQLPKQAFQLHADHAPLAMGLAQIMRRRAHDWLAQGVLKLSLEDLATEAGDDVRGGKRKLGRSYWKHAIEKFQKIAVDGGFGSCSASRDADNATIVTLEPSDALATVYSSILHRIEDRKAFVQKAELEAEVRKLLPPKRSAGRPRKLPGGIG